MIRIGIVGIGFMGYTHFEAAQSLTNAKVTAIATRSRRKRDGDWTGIQGNFGPRAGQYDLSDIKCYENHADLLADPEIDLVDICLPTDLHESITIEALRAGKHVLVEKPIAIDLAAAERMVQAANDADRLLMVGHVLPFFPEFRFVADAIASGTWGRLRAAHFRRVICPPDWSAEMSDFRRLGGWGIDLHIHDNHFIRHACGMPLKVFSNGLLQDGFVNHVHTQYVYESGRPTVSCVSGGIAASGFQFGHGFEVYLDDATILFDAGTYAGEWVVNRPLTLVMNDGKAETPDLSGDDSWCAAFNQELNVAVSAVATGADPGVLSGALALDALKMCYAETRSIEQQQTIPLS